MEDVVGVSLRESRIRFQREMVRALNCIKKEDKVALAAEWRGRYGKYHYKELIACAKNKSVARDIVNWKIDEL